MEEYLVKYEKWLNNPCFDENTKKELEAIKGNDKEIEDRFYKDLEFGTAGLRGVIGAGTNRMNKYTVGKATQGLANFILKEGTGDKGFGRINGKTGRTAAEGAPGGRKERETSGRGRKNQRGRREIRKKLGGY